MGFEGEGQHKRQCSLLCFDFTFLSLWVGGLQTCVYAHACMPMHAYGNWRSLTDGFYIPLHTPLREGLLVNLELVVVSKLPGLACLYQHQPRTEIAVVWGARPAFFNVGMGTST